MNRKERTVLITIIINLLLVAFKYALAGASGSLSLRASALHSVADAVISGFVFIGLLISRWEKPDRSKSNVNLIENLVALAIAGAIFYVGFDIVREVLGREPPDARLGSSGWSVSPNSLNSLSSSASLVYITPALIRMLPLNHSRFKLN